MKKFVKKLPTLTGSRYTRITDPVADSIEMLSVSRHHNPGAATTNTPAGPSRPKFISFVKSVSETKAKKAQKGGEPRIPPPPFPDPKDVNLSVARRLFSLCCPAGLVVGAIVVVRTQKNTFSWRVDYINKGLDFPSPVNFDLKRARSILQSATPAGGVLTTLSTVTSKRDVRWCACYRVSTRRSHVREVVRGLVEYLVARITPSCMENKGVNDDKPDRSAVFIAASQKVQLNLGKDVARQVVSVRVKDPRSGVITFEPIQDVNRLLIPQKVFYGTTDVTCAMFGKTRVIWKDIDTLLMGSNTKVVRNKNPLIEQIQTIVHDEVKKRNASFRPDLGMNENTANTDYSDKVVHARLSSAANLSLLHEYLIASETVPSDKFFESVTFDENQRGTEKQMRAELTSWIVFRASQANSDYKQTRPKYTVDELRVELTSKGIPTGQDAWGAYFGRVTPSPVTSSALRKAVTSMYRHEFR